MYHIIVWLHTFLEYKKKKTSETHNVTEVLSYSQFVAVVYKMFFLLIQKVMLLNKICLNFLYKREKLVKISVFLVKSRIWDKSVIKYLKW